MQVHYNIPQHGKIRAYKSQFLYPALYPEI